MNKYEGLWSDNDVVDGYVDKFHEKSYKSHDAETDGGGDSYFLEFWKKKEMRHWYTLDYNNAQKTKLPNMILT